MTRKDNGSAVEEEQKDHTEIKGIRFDYRVGDIVISRPIDKDRTSLDLWSSNKDQIQYRVLSRMYEEIQENGTGVVTYAVKHIDIGTPGGGKVFRMAQDEIMLYSSYRALRAIVDSACDEVKKKQAPQAQKSSHSPATVGGNIFSGYTTGTTTISPPITDNSTLWIKDPF